MGPGRSPSTGPSDPPDTRSPPHRLPDPPDQADPAAAAPTQQDGERGTDEDRSALAALIDAHPLFVDLPAGTREAMAAAGRIEHCAPGQLIMDAFGRPSVEVFLVLSGQVDLWNEPDRIREAPDERLGPGRLFGFSAMLTARSIGPRAVAFQQVRVAALPAEVVEPAFASRQGARFLAAQAAAPRQETGGPSYSLVDDLIVTEPLTVSPADLIADVARRMSERGAVCATVDRGEGRFGLITDAILRQKVLVEGLPGTAPVSSIMDTGVPVAVLGDSAAEALILMLDSAAEFLLVTDHGNTLRGVITPRDFAISPTTAGVALHEQMRRAATVDELHERARRVPAMLGDLLGRGLASGKVIAVHSSILDTIVRRAIQLTFARHPELSLDAFTWLSLGSNGRREAMLSSDVDSAAAFDDSVSEAEIDRYRVVFAEVNRVLADSGLISDHHGATAEHRSFARTNASWRAAAREWLAAPEDNKGAVMTSLLVDGRPIHGDPGLPAAAKVFSDLRSHPMTMRLLLKESLSRRAKLRSMRDIFARPDTFDLKGQALLPIVNIGRWAALSVGSAALPTVERLRVAGGSMMLPDEQAQNLIEAFEVLQRLRLRYQLAQRERGEPPSDLLTKDRMTPIDRSIVAQAVHEIAAVQRRMDQVSAYLPAASWATPATS